MVFLPNLFPGPGHLFDKRQYPRPGASAAGTRVAIHPPPATSADRRARYLIHAASPRELSRTHAGAVGSHMLLDITFELTTCGRPITCHGRDSQSSAAAATPGGIRHDERHLGALGLSGGEGDARRIRRRRMRPPELLGGRARPNDAVGLCAHAAYNFWSAQPPSRTGSTRSSSASTTAATSRSSASMTRPASQHPGSRPRTRSPSARTTTGPNAPGLHPP